MPRQARIAVPDVIYHVMARGNNRQWIYHDDEDFLKFLDICRKYKNQYDLKFFHWALMSNHLHLLLQPPAWTAMAKAMQGIKLTYTHWYNRKYRRTGHLWQGRFKSCPIEADNYLLACGRYVERNPVRAGLVASPVDYPWTSYASHVQGKGDGLTDMHSLLEAYGKDLQTTREEWSRFVCTPQHEEEIELQHQIDCGWVGSSSFIANVQSFATEQRRPKRGRPRK